MELDRRNSSSSSLDELGAWDPLPVSPLVPHYKTLWSIDYIQISNDFLVFI